MANKGTRKTKRTIKGNLGTVAPRGFKMVPSKVFAKAVKTINKNLAAIDKSLAAINGLNLGQYGA